MASGIALPNAIPTSETRPHSVVAAHSGARWETIARWLTWVAFALVLGLAALAPIVRTGDAHQYHAMAAALATWQPPALTAAEVDAFKAWLLAQPDDAGFASSVRAVDQPPLIVDGRQEFSHFWLYPLLAAPVIALLAQAELHPGYAFLAVNAALLAFALWQVQRAYSAVVSLLLLASPLVWFVNKAQVEVFTVSLLCVAMAQARRGNWLCAGLAAAAASTQNIPILGAVACFWGAGLLRQLVVRERRAVTPGGVFLVLLTVLVGALHPAYYLWRLGVLTPQRLNGGIHFRLPSPEHYLAVLLDPNIGLLPWLPLTGLVAAIGLGLIWLPARSGIDLLAPHPARINPQATVPARINPLSPNPGGTRRGTLRHGDSISSRGDRLVRRPAAPTGGQFSGRLDFRLAGVCGLVIGAWFLFVFAQTTNVNSGGTVHISRYALWLLPLSLPFLDATAAWLRPYLPGLLPVAGALAVIGYGVLFRPGQPERYVTPSPQAAFMTTWLPELYRTVPEIFYERQLHQDGGVRGAAATTGCRVILLPVATDAPCALSPAEAGAASELFADGWDAVWIIRPGPFGLGDGGVTGALPSS